MSETNQSLVLRWARWQTRALVRLWPEESRSWGQAIASEAEEIEQPLQAVGWALGGVTVYLRALGAHLWQWLKMPVGKRGEETAPLAGAPGPKRSRLFTAAVLTCAVGLLCLPEGREAIRTVRLVWEGYAQVDTGQAELEKLAARGEKENDAQAVAFAGLSIEDGQKATQFAERAVQMEPSLKWIYAARRFWPVGTPAGQAWIARGEALDSENAVVYLLAADAISETVYAELIRRHASTEPEAKRALSANAEWVALMEKTLHAARFNSYYAEHQELARQVWKRNPQLPVGTILAALWRHPIAALPLAQFTKLLAARAEQELAAGHLEKAQELLGEIDTLGARAQEDAERSGGTGGVVLSLRRESALSWKSFYEKTGQQGKAEESALRAGEIDRRIAEYVREAQRRWEQRSRRRGIAWAVQVSALILPISALAAFLGIGWFELIPQREERSRWGQRFLRGLADFAPALVFLASVTFVVSFLPYAKEMAKFRESGSGVGSELQLSASFWSLVNVTWAVAGPRSRWC